MATPPATESEYFSNTESNIDSDFVTQSDLESDVEGGSVNPRGANLAAIDETLSDIASPALGPVEEPPESDCETWSLVGDADIESSNELETGMEELTLEDGGDADKTFTAESPLRAVHRPYPLGAARRAVRSASSPSRSPVRRRRRGLKPALATRNVNGRKRTLYEFVFQ